MAHLYLVHHGIKGQKWGVRRFQNPDGTLTDRGKDRYRKTTDYVLPKNTTIVRYTPNNDEKSLKTRYASYTYSDVETYRDNAYDQKLGFNNVKSFYAVEITNIAPATIRRGKAVINDLLAEKADTPIDSYNRLNDAGYLNDKLDAFSRHWILEDNPELREHVDKLKDYIHDEIYKDRDEFVKKYANKYDAIIDPEDFIWNYEAPLIFTKDDKFKKTGSTKFNIY